VCTTGLSMLIHMPIPLSSSLSDLVDHCATFEWHWKTARYVSSSSNGNTSSMIRLLNSILGYCHLIQDVQLTPATKVPVSCNVCSIFSIYSGVVLKFCAESVSGQNLAFSFFSFQHDVKFWLYFSHTFQILSIRYCQLDNIRAFCTSQFQTDLNFIWNSWWVSSSN